MRHANVGRNLSRTSAHRISMFNNMVTSLFRHEAIKTTAPKAKEARKIAERMITLGKKGSLHARRQANKTVRDSEVLGKLFDGLAERYAKRAGGYTRITRLGARRGDNAEMVLLELVDRVIAPAGGEEAPEVEAEETKPAKGAKKAAAPKAEKAEKAPKAKKEKAATSEAAPKKKAAKKKD